MQGINRQDELRVQEVALSVNQFTKKYIELAIVNLNLALDKDDPSVTWAVLLNIQQTIDGYIQQTNKEREAK